MRPRDHQPLPHPHSKMTKQERENELQRITYAERVRQLEAEGMTTSDAQGVADCEQMQGRKFDFDPENPLDNWTPKK